MPPTVQPATFEHLPQALGVGTPAPRLSWKTKAEPGWMQEAYGTFKYSVAQVS